MNPRQKPRNFLFFCASFLFLIATDQLTKYIVHSHSTLNESGFYICNRGIAFGLEIPASIFYTLWTIIILILVSLLLKNFTSYKYSLTLVLAGAFSNLLDRFYYGCVIDFIDLKIWPVFNLADVFICLGVFMLILKTIQADKKNKA